MTGKSRLTLVALLVLLLAGPVHAARSGSETGAGLQRYVIELLDPPLAAYEGQQLSVSGRNGKDRMAATAAFSTGEEKLNMHSPESVAYLQFLAERQQEFLAEASLTLGRTLSSVHRYRAVNNGLALDLSAAEAELLAQSSLVKVLETDTRHQLQTFAGPKWIGAGAIWDGTSGFSDSRGEGIIVGIIDSGINWDHPSFANPSIDGYTHTNPLPGELGLCTDPVSGAQCNGKLIGVYDFVMDNPDTEDVVEENTNGKDNSGHGSHVASTVAGNPVSTFEDVVSVTLSGVAPRANIIAYRVCYQGEPVSADSAGCMGSAILSAIDQAVADGVDVINYSIGSGPSDPWRFGSIARAYLTARSAGVFVATSAGNDGPNPGTIGSPANAPWIVAVGNATHNVLFGSALQGLSGGDTTPPPDLLGASLTSGIGVRKIVHARDYGNALCGEGPAELQASCAANLGLSNPWDGQTPFNGEIVVCDRGEYGRIEKGKNVFLAGAGGYILANTEDQGESVVTDNHCLPATHIGDKDGDKLRDWLASGSDHEGSISGYSLVEQDSFGDQVNQSSSRGPGLPPVADVLKPNVIAPGTSILAASDLGQSFLTLSGTSMSSPHVTGAAALIKSVHPDWTVNQIASAIELTSTAEVATDRGSEPGTPHIRGAGRPQIGQAVNAGLYLEVTTSEFNLANPASGGEPKELNLSGLVDSNCQAECSFQRKVTDMMGGGSWTATAVGFPEGTEVEISPSSFSLSNGQSRELTIALDISDSGVVGEWVYGSVRLSAAGSPDLFLTAAVYSDGGDLPETWIMNDDRNGGWQELTLSGLVALPDATFTSGGLVRPSYEVLNLIEDPSFENAYDGGSGVYTAWHSMPLGALWLYAETLDSTAEDVDLFVGRDDNGNGRADESEQLCASTSPDELELCDLYNLPPGSYWVLVQNWTGTEAGGDDIPLIHAGVGPSDDSNLAVSGPGITEEGTTIPLRVSWDNLDALPGDQFFGAIGVGSDRDTPNNLGVIPVRLNRNGISDAETFPLINGVTHHLALDAGDTHDQIFIDVPPGTDSLTVFTDGADETQNNSLRLELKRLDFDDAFSEPPFAASAADAATLVSADGVGGVGPSITVVGVDPGRWYAVLSNSNDSPTAVSIQATANLSGDPLAAQSGLWEPGSRPGLGQGYESSEAGSYQALIWYTYDEDGHPAWYISSNPISGSNIWSSDLLRFTNDGAEQHFARVGRVTITRLGVDDTMFSYTLFGQSGSERMQPISAPTCPQIGGSAKSYTGLWYRGIDGLGGASALVNASTQSQIHYLFDDAGMPRWLYAQDLVNPEPTNSEIPILQFSGYCAVCDKGTVSSQTVGMLERIFDSETSGSWTLDYVFEAPLSGSVDRTDSIIKLTDMMECQ